MCEWTGGIRGISMEAHLFPTCPCTCVLFFPLWNWHWMTLNDIVLTQAKDQELILQFHCSPSQIYPFFIILANSCTTHLSLEGLLQFPHDLPFFLSYLQNCYSLCGQKISWKQRNQKLSKSSLVVPLIVFKTLHYSRISFFLFLLHNTKSSIYISTFLQCFKTACTPHSLTSRFLLQTLTTPNLLALFTRSPWRCHFFGEVLIHRSRFTSHMVHLSFAS